MQTKSSRPESASSAAVVSIGLLTLFGCFSAIKFLQLFNDNLVFAAVFCMFTTGAVIFSLDFFWKKVHLRKSTGLDFTISNPSWSRVLIKLVGLELSVGFIALLYWLFPEYHGDYYDLYWKLLRTLWPIWFLTSIPYFYFVDKRMLNPEDAYFHMGNLFFLNFKKVDMKIVGQHLLGWLIKGFFLPLMFIYFCGDLRGLIRLDFEKIVSFKHFYDAYYDTIFLVDVGIVSMGYLLSLKLFDTHIRSAEPTMTGWVVALICYDPFASLIGRNYFNYTSDYAWGAWLFGNPLAYGIWGSIILILFSIYVWASLMFGCRFSNLTHRGILTNGPYKYTKHPAYISKNIGWWMISIPFLAQGGVSVALSKSLLLLAFNAVYFIRAKTEERNLSQDSTYVQYAEWMEKNGIFSWLSDMPTFKFIRYKNPRAL